MSSPLPSPSPSPSPLQAASSTAAAAAASTGGTSSFASLATTPAASSATSPFSSTAGGVNAVAEYWQTTALPVLQKELDQYAQAVADGQAESEASRKRLVEFTRDFRKSLTEETKVALKPIITRYQAEIDALSKRCKSVEMYLAAVYKKLSDAPDPVPALKEAAALQLRLISMRDVDVENRKLRETLDEYHKELAEVKNQEVTITKLREKLKELEQGIDSAVQKKTKVSEQQVQEQFLEKERLIQQQKIELATRLGQQEELVVLLQSKLEAAQTQQMDLKARHDEEVQAKASEMEMLVQDLERTTNRATAFERQVNQLQQQLAELRDDVARHGASGNGLTSLQGSSMKDLASRMSQLELEVQSKEREISLLVEELHKNQLSATKAKEMHARDAAELDSQIQELTEYSRSLEQQIAAQSDYDEIKKELAVLKMIEFAGQSDDTASPSQDTALLGSKTIETLLLEKNRNLLSEVTQLKMNLNLREEELRLLRQTCSEQGKALESQKSLILQLEADLVNVAAPISSAKPASTTNHVSVLLDATTSSGTPSSLVAPEQLAPSLSSSVAIPAATDPSGANGDSSSLLPIVASQRDRFRQRNTELEVENRELQQLVSSLRSDIETLRSDNVKLFEKVKFFQTYPSKTASNNDALDKYSSQYEENLNPFKEFNAQEKARKYQALSPAERATLNIGRFVMSNKYTRSFVFFYTIILHALVFLVLYKMSWSQACNENSATECTDKLSLHMKEFHPR